MASTDAHPFPIKGKAWRATFPIFTSAGLLVTTGTQTVTISKDAATFANPSAGSTSATQIATTSGVWYVDLSGTDTTCDTLAVKISDGTNPPTIMVLCPLALVEPSGAPSFGSGGSGIEEVLAWLLAHSRNKKTQTDSTSTIYKDDGTTVQSTSTVSDNGSGTTTFAEWT